MPVETVYPHILSEPGKPACLQRPPHTRVSEIVLDHTEQGWSADEIQRQHPYLRLAEIHSALAFYFDHPEAVEAEIAAEVLEAGQLANATPKPPFLPQLLARKRRDAEIAAREAMLTG